jgi:hypothetical protein
MKTFIKNILIGAVLFISAGQALAYPPDNAAVLYYKSFMILEEPNESLKKMLRDLKDGNTPLNEPIRQYIDKNRKVINEVVTAAEIKNCDWGLDFSDWFDTKIEHLSKCRQMGYVLAADAKIFAEKGDYQTALERCFAIYKMGEHVGNDTVIQGLVSVAMRGMANDCIIDILPEVSGDIKTLEWLKLRFTDIADKSFSLKAALANETKITGQKINKQNAISVAEVIYEPCDIPKEILSGDDEFFERVKEYFQNYTARAQIAFDLPYTEAMKTFEDLDNELRKAAEEKPEVKLSMFIYPAVGRVYSIDTRIKTHNNAILAGIEIYIIRAKTGKLPDELPEGLPKDLFSGKDFLYEKTDTGFVLKCQGKDLAYDTVRQFEFNIAN